MHSYFRFVFISRLIITPTTPIHLFVPYRSLAYMIFVMHEQCKHTVAHIAIRPSRSLFLSGLRVYRTVPLFTEPL